MINMPTFEIKTDKYLSFLFPTNFFVKLFIFFTSLTHAFRPNTFTVGGKDRVASYILNNNSPRIVAFYIQIAPIVLNICEVYEAHCNRCFSTMIKQNVEKMWEH